MSNHADAPVEAGAIRGAIDFGRLPWIRPLARAYAEDFSSVAALFAGDPTDPGAWRHTIARVQRVSRDRAELAALVGAQLARRGAPPEAKAAAASLNEPATVAVVTGQQAGVFGGPLYTLLKAATAIQLARHVRSTYGTPAVPVFWVDADDHDWAEVRSATVLDPDFAVRTLPLATLPGAGTHPVAALVLNHEVDELISALEQALAPSAFTTELMAGLRRHYRPDATMAGAFAGWLDDLLGRFGLVVFESADPRGRRLVADLFARELEHPGRTAELALEAAATMRRFGHAPQVEPGDDNVALFYVDAAGRRPIRRRDRQLSIGSTLHDRAALHAEALSHPDRFSPNVLLRPLVQDRLFPTVCYVGGPSELAYQAQLTGVYREFGVEPPLLYARASVTVVDSAAARFLERSQLPLEQLAAQDESVLNRLLQSQLPPGLDVAFDELDRLVAGRLAAIAPGVAAVDPTLSGAVDTTRQKVQESLRAMQAKIVHAAKRKDETLRRQFLRTRALTFPAGTPQERLLNVAFFVNRYGPSLADRLLEVLPLDTGKHYIVAL